jgi:SAM-dependent methyltransferase
VKHAELAALYARLAGVVADAFGPGARVLELGAGAGDATLPLLERGLRVTAVDESAERLAQLAASARAYADRLTTERGDAAAVVERLEPGYDALVASSFLHHVPDYAALLRSALRLLRPRAHVLLFQDPSRKLGRGTRWFSTVAYLTWRTGRGDIAGGAHRRLRRMRGIWLDAPEDEVEYHALRGGLDEDAVCDVLREADFECEVVRYFSTQSTAFQRLGTALGLANTFAVSARRAA